MVLFLVFLSMSCKTRTFNTDAGAKGLKETVQSCLFTAGLVLAASISGCSNPVETFSPAPPMTEAKFAALDPQMMSNLKNSQNLQKIGFDQYIGSEAEDMVTIQYQQPSDWWNFRSNMIVSLYEGKGIQGFSAKPTSQFTLPIDSEYWNSNYGWRLQNYEGGWGYRPAVFDMKLDTGDINGDKKADIIAHRVDVMLFYWTEVYTDSDNKVQSREHQVVMDIKFNTTIYVNQGNGTFKMQQKLKAVGSGDSFKRQYQRYANPWRRSNMNNLPGFGGSVLDNWQTNRKLLNQFGGASRFSGASTPYDFAYQAAFSGQNPNQEWTTGSTFNLGANSPMLQRFLNKVTSKYEDWDRSALSTNSSDTMLDIADMDGNGVDDFVILMDDGNDLIGVVFLAFNEEGGTYISPNPVDIFVKDALFGRSIEDIDLENFFPNASPGQDFVIRSNPSSEKQHRRFIKNNGVVWPNGEGNPGGYLNLTVTQDTEITLPYKAVTFRWFKTGFNLKDDGLQLDGDGGAEEMLLGVFNVGEKGKEKETPGIVYWTIGDVMPNAAGLDATAQGLKEFKPKPGTTGADATSLPSGLAK